MGKVIYKCAVNGILEHKMIGRKKVMGICGKIKVGDESICGAGDDIECKHKIKQE